MDLCRNDDPTLLSAACQGATGCAAALNAVDVPMGSRHKTVQVVVEHEEEDDTDMRDADTYAYKLLGRHERQASIRTGQNVRLSAGGYCVTGCITHGAEH